MRAVVAGGRGEAAAAGAARREDPSVEAAVTGAREERTLNMLCMSVTLEVSRLSGWLNADALCQDQREA
jgi:hypothetical protein